MTKPIVYIWGPSIQFLVANPTWDINIQDSSEPGQHMVAVSQLDLALRRLAALQVPQDIMHQACTSVQTFKANVFRSSGWQCCLHPGRVM